MHSGSREKDREKLSEKEKAIEFYRKAATAILHICSRKRSLPCRRSRFFCPLEKAGSQPAVQTSECAGKH